jgi:hypothetical protein
MPARNQMLTIWNINFGPCGFSFKDISSSNQLCSLQILYKRNMSASQDQFQNMSTIVESDGGMWTLGLQPEQKKTKLSDIVNCDSYLLNLSQRMDDTARDSP